MTFQKKLGILSAVTLLGVGAYGLRRRILSRWLGLRPARYRVHVQPGVRVPMPDGTTLVADLYTPHSSRLFPTVLIRTPYGRGRAGGVNGWMSGFAARRFAERGYNVLMQDVRGRFDSAAGPGGEFDPFRYESADGRATLQWIEAQPWFNGLVGMWGPSYLGYVQWAAAPHAPLSLKAIVPAMSGTRLPVMGMRDGAIGADMQLRWIHSLEQAQRRGIKAWLPLGRRDQRLEDRAMLRAAATLPLSRADQAVAGRSVPFFQDWLAHPDVDDPYWQAVDPGREMQQVNAAAHLVGGWYDILLRETLEDYAALCQAGRRPHLTVGPWTHRDYGGLMECLRLGMVWFDAHLKGDRRGLPAHPVRVYVMGRGIWQELDQWPPPSQPLTGYLYTGRALLPVPPVDLAENPPDSYTFDPEHPTPALGGNLLSVHAGRVDNRPLEARPDVLTYTTPTLERDWMVMGAPRLTLYVRSDRAYTDFFARLCDVHPGGASYNVTDGFLRLQPGRGEVQSDGSLRIEIELMHTAHCFISGHRLRLQVSSGAHPRWARNPGTGERLATAVTMLPARQTIFHDPAHPSRLILPEVS